MEKFIQENWFKISAVAILFIVGLSAVYYFVFFLPKQYNAQQNEQTQAKLSAQQQADNFNLQTKCADAADKFFNKNGYGSHASVRTGYVSHWNKVLNKCFIEFSDGVGNNGISYELADAIEGIEYAEIKWDIPNEDHPDWCELYPDGFNIQSNYKNCISKSEFDNFTKPFMSN